MATARGWAKKTWRAKQVLCGVSSTGLTFQTLGGPPEDVSVTLTNGVQQLVLTFGSDSEVEKIIDAFIDFQQRRQKGKYGAYPQR